MTARAERERGVHRPRDADRDATELTGCGHQIPGIRDDVTLDLTRTRELSRTLFGGAQYRIEVGAAIAGTHGMVCIVDLVGTLGQPPSQASVNAELKVLERAGLLSRAEKRQGERRVYLIPQRSPYWELCRTLRDQTSRRQKKSSRR